MRISLRKIMICISQMLRWLATVRLLILMVTPYSWMMGFHLLIKVGSPRGSKEVRHVAIGSRWFRYLCEQRGLAPEATFRSLLREYYAGGLRGPFNYQARLDAGFTESELEDLELAG